VPHTELRQSRSALAASERDSGVLRAAPCILHGVSSTFGWLIEEHVTRGGGNMRRTVGWRSRATVGVVALLALAGCGSSSKFSVKSTPTTSSATTATTVVRTATTLRPKPTIPPTTAAPVTAPPQTQPPATSPPATVAPATVAPAQNCPNGDYINSSGNTVCSPYSASSAPPGATAKCNDGTYSFSQHRSGTCSHHGGVAQWL